MTAPPPVAVLFPDLDLPLEDLEEPLEDWSPDHSDEPELAFVPLFQPVRARPVGVALSAMLAEARDEAFNAGMAAGREAEQASRETAAAESLSRVADAMADAVADARWAAEAVAEQTAAEMARLVSEVIAHALPSLAAQVARQDATAFVAGLLPALAAEPCIDIRVASGVAPTLAEQLATQPTVHVTADPALPEGDVRIAWRDGQAEHRHAAFRSAILGMIADLLAPAGDQHATPTGTKR